MPMLMPMSVCRGCAERRRPRQPPVYVHAKTSDGIHSGSHQWHGENSPECGLLAGLQPHVRVTLQIPQYLVHSISLTGSGRFWTVPAAAGQSVGWQQQLRGVVGEVANRSSHVRSSSSSARQDTSSVTNNDMQTTIILQYIWVLWSKFREQAAILVELFLLAA